MARNRLGHEGGHLALRIADRQADGRLAGRNFVQQRRQLGEGRRRKHGKAAWEDGHQGSGIRFRLI